MIQFCKEKQACKARCGSHLELLAETEDQTTKAEEHGNLFGPGCSLKGCLYKLGR